MSPDWRSMQDEPQQPGTQSQQESPERQEQPVPKDAADHGATGEGSGSALARLISQEQSRVVPGSAENAANGSS